MSTREEYTKLLTRSHNLSERSKTLQDEEYENEQVRKKLACKIILEEKLLQITSWVLDWYDEQPTLLAEYSVNDKRLHPLISLTDGGYDSFELESGIDLGISDENISIEFRDSNAVAIFIKRHDLSVDRKHLREKESELKKQLLDLQKYKAI